MTAPAEKWTEIELLPEWAEEFYDVYTAKKFGKWVMLKTLKPELKGIQEYDAMLEREFEVRYNLAHAHIIMINDLEEVPGVGLSIITDDVYGDSLQKLIDKGEVTPDIIRKLARCLPDAMDYIEANHIVHQPITTRSVIFTEKIRNLKLIDVGFDQKNVLSPADVQTDIHDFGQVLLKAIDACSEEEFPHLRAVAERCISAKPYRSVQQLQLAIHGGSTSRLYLVIITLLIIMVAILSVVIANIK